MLETSSPDNTAKPHFSAGYRPHLRRAIEIWGWIVLILLILTGLSSVISRALFLNSAIAMAPVDPLLEFGPFDSRYYTNIAATLLHLVPGLLIFILGPIQFIPSLRKRNLKWHRISGRIYLISGFMGAVSGFIIGTLNPFMGFTGQGFNEAMATAFLSAYVFFCLIMAIYHIRNRRIGPHREWMIRGFALMTAIATERLMLTGFRAALDVDIGILFGTTFWMAAILNLAIAESWITLTRTPGNAATHWKDLDRRAKAA
jgi:uncharacterized membrane protein